MFDKVHNNKCGYLDVVYNRNHENFLRLGWNFIGQSFRKLEIKFLTL